jgi:hypothetical protein
MSVRIILCSNPVQLTARLARTAGGALLLDSHGKPQLELSHRGEPVAPNPGDGLVITLESPDPVTVVIPDFDDESEHWTVTATPKGTAGNPGEPPDGGPDWERRQTLCTTRFAVTEPLPITVTATSGAGASVHRPIFVEVLPEGAKPW